MSTISNFEGHSQIINALNNEEFDFEILTNYLSQNNIIPESPELYYETQRYIVLQQMKMQEVRDIFESQKLNSELKKMLMCDKLPFRTKLKDPKRYILIQWYLNKVLYNNSEFDVYNNAKYFNAVDDTTIKLISNYFEERKIKLNDAEFIKRMLCNYENPYKKPNELKEDFDKKDSFNEYDINKIIGRYSELTIYKMLRENLKEDEEIKWVAKDVGDFFGYDIIVYNKKTNKIKLVEVKSSYNNGGLLTLSSNEYDKLQESISSNIDYEMYKIEYNSNEEIIYRVIHEKDDYFKVENFKYNKFLLMKFKESVFDKTKKELPIRLTEYIGNPLNYTLENVLK